MAGSSFGENFRVTTWGESHGKAIGAVVDGVPAGIPLCEDDIQVFLDRRKPGTSSITTPRKEDDKVEILSGIFDGKTTGTPISLLVRNTSQHSSDYNEIASYYRPGHADYTYDQKYGFRDYRGGGRSSGRETIGRVCGGAIAAKVLKELGIEVYSYTSSIGPYSINSDTIDTTNIGKFPTGFPDKELNDLALTFLEECKAKKDSAGGSVVCTATGLPAGLGEPVFDKLDAQISKALFSIGAVKAVEFGDGLEASKSTGSQNNDAFESVDGTIRKKTNHSGGVLGGLSDGSPLVVKAYFKPTPSISKPQQTVKQDGTPIEVEIKGRHDPIIVPRAVVVVESMVNIVLVDALLSGLGSRIDNLKKIYL